jgi:hypothetical protein
MGKANKRNEVRWMATAAMATAGAAALLALAPTPTRAALSVNVVQDTWLDGTDTDPAAPQYSEYGTDTDADGNIESVWYQGGVGTLDPVGAGGPERGNLTAGGASSATWTTYFTPEATPISLGQADHVKLTWKFIPTNVNATNGSNNLRVALMDSPAASRITANGTPASAAYTGYALFMNMGQTLAVTNPMQLKERAVASGDTLSTSGNWGANGVASANLATAGTNGATGFVAGTEYTLVMDLSRTLSDQLQVDASMSGGSLNNTGSINLSFTDPSPNMGSFNFDTFQVRPSGATTTAELFDTTLFKVEAPIPEPASMALLAGPALAMMFRRRRNATR